jgi:ADP-ribose pyrophosphatase YjhB (NUDIX family)
LSSHLQSLLDEALEHIPDARAGLPREAFYFVSQLTPLINVDLLVKNKLGQSLLTWRHDQFYGPAWHLPGGIIRFKESITDRLIKVAEIELGCKVKFDPEPINVRSQITEKRDIRGHFISLLYLCELDGNLDSSRRAEQHNPQNGEWQWHDKAPVDLLGVHESFRKFINGTPHL